MPCCHVFSARPGSPRLSRCLASWPQRMLVSRTQTRMMSRSDSARPNFSRTASVSRMRRTLVASRRVAGRLSRFKNACDDLAGAADAPVGHTERNPFAALFGRVEHRLDKRRVSLNIRRHHEHVAGRQLRVALEPVEQVIVEHFHLAQRAVTGVHPQRSVRLGQSKAWGSPPAPGPAGERGPPGCAEAGSPRAARRRLGPHPSRRPRAPGSGSRGPTVPSRPAGGCPLPGGVRWRRRLLSRRP